MLVNLVEVAIQRDPVERIFRVVPSFEAKVLAEVMGMDAVATSNAVDIMEADGAAELHRMERIYGGNEKTGLSYVRQAFPNGVDDLMAFEIVEKPTTEKVKASKDGG